MRTFLLMLTLLPLLVRPLLCGAEEHDTTQLKDSSMASSNSGAFPADLPKKWNETGRKFVEINAYAGPSFANSGGVGAGARLLIDDIQATEEGFGLNWEAVFGGGFYPGGGTYSGGSLPREMQAQVIGGAAMATGYYGVEGLKNGISPHLLLEFISLSSTVIGTIEQMVSYNPSLELGLHGRNDGSQEFWSTQVNFGINYSYTTGALAKLNPSGGTTYTFLAPFGAVEGFFDKKLTENVYLRFEGTVSAIFDSLGSYGSRSIFQVNTHAFLKIGPTLYTGPAFLYTDQQRTADFATRTYVPSAPQYSVSWLLGGTVAAF